MLASKKMNPYFLRDYQRRIPSTEVLTAKEKGFYTGIFSSRGYDTENAYNYYQDEVWDARSGYLQGIGDIPRADEIDRYRERLQTMDAALHSGISSGRYRDRMAEVMALDDAFHREVLNRYPETGPEVDTWLRLAASWENRLRPLLPSTGLGLGGWLGLAAAGIVIGAILIRKMR